MGKLPGVSLEQFLAEAEAKIGPEEIDRTRREFAEELRKAGAPIPPLMAAKLKQ
jgi:hypothetical protein